MTVETKHNIGDMVFVLFLNKIYEIEIKHIGITITVPQISTVYHTSELYDKVWDKTIKCFLEENLFATKQELLNSL